MIKNKRGPGGPRHSRPGGRRYKFLVDMGWIKSATPFLILGILTAQTRSCIPLLTFLLSNLEFASRMREGKGEPHVSTR